MVNAGSSVVGSVPSNLKTPPRRASNSLSSRSSTTSISAVAVSSASAVAAATAVEVA